MGQGGGDVGRNGVENDAQRGECRVGESGPLIRWRFGGIRGFVPVLEFGQSFQEGPVVVPTPRCGIALTLGRAAADRGLGVGWGFCCFGSFAVSWGGPVVFRGAMGPLGGGECTTRGSASAQSPLWVVNMVLLRCQGSRSILFFSLRLVGWHALLVAGSDHVVEQDLLRLLPLGVLSWDDVLG